LKSLITREFELTIPCANSHTISRWSLQDASGRTRHLCKRTSTLILVYRYIIIEPIV
jgi:hypothetical protein